MSIVRDEHTPSSFLPGDEYLLGRLDLREESQGLMPGAYYGRLSKMKVFGEILRECGVLDIPVLEVSPSMWGGDLESAFQHCASVQLVEWDGKTLSAEADPLFTVTQLHIPRTRSKVADLGGRVPYWLVNQLGFQELVLHYDSVDGVGACSLGDYVGHEE